MLTVYFASRYARREEMEGYARVLQALGYAIGSQWVFGNRDIVGNPEKVRHFVTLDRGDLLSSNLIISFAEPKEVDYPRGSRHWETAMGYERGKVVYIVGRFGVELECVFHNLEGIVIFDNWETLLSHLTQLIVFDKAWDTMRKITHFPNFNGENPHAIADPGPYTFSSLTR